MVTGKEDQGLGTTGLQDHRTTGPPSRSKMRYVIQIPEGFESKYFRDLGPI